MAANASRRKGVEMSAENNRNRLFQLCNCNAERLEAGTDADTLSNLLKWITR